ncbi:UBX domain-containing protein 2 [Oncorhynchus mykiss]|uniref:UBX domain-containing protein 2 n=1 Tax=Oncorhynchus mykiss TaxID=8022 RepID=C1BEW5_ONCMY|nr:UBX domain-containing protein 2 [Oncorhynchus mykiss]ACO07568.1 UBX domain-containing protein 2 [Oncorhynchus mykiss]
MIWFEGSIPAAIISAKQQSSIFVAVITGDDEVSGQMMSSWEDDRVAEASYNCCVAIKVDSKSETCTQFSQIYIYQELCQACHVC